MESSLPVAERPRRPEWMKVRAPSRDGAYFDVNQDTATIFSDVAVHAGTKYLGGHSDVLVGLIVCSEATYPRMHRLWTDMGVALSSDDAFLALRGLRTLAVRFPGRVCSR